MTQCHAQMTQCHAQTCRVGTGAGTAIDTNESLPYAVPTTASIQAALSLVGTAYARLFLAEKRCQRLCPPYEPQTDATFWQIETTRACDFNGGRRGVGLAMIFRVRICEICRKR